MDCNSYLEKQNIEGQSYLKVTISIKKGTIAMKILMSRGDVKLHNCIPTIHLLVFSLHLFLKVYTNLNKIHFEASSNNLD